MGAIYAKVRGNTSRLVVNEQGQLLPRDQRPLVQICARGWQDPCGCRPAAPLTHTGSVPPVGGRQSPSTICSTCHSTVCHCGREPEPPLAARAPRTVWRPTVRQAKWLAMRAEMVGVPPPPKTLEEVVRIQQEHGRR
jgi:hypothetical protein